MPDEIFENDYITVNPNGTVSLSKFSFFMLYQFTSFSEKAFNVLGAEVLEQSDYKAVAGKKTGVASIICTLCLV